MKAMNIFSRKRLSFGCLSTTILRLRENVACRSPKSHFIQINMPLLWLSIVWLSRHLMPSKFIVYNSNKQTLTITLWSIVNIWFFNLLSIIRLGQLGLLDYWWKSALPPPNRCTASTSPLKRTSNKRLNVNYLSSVFLLYGVGVAVSFLAFVSELLFHYSKRILFFSRLELFYKNKGKHNCFSNISM